MATTPLYKRIREDIKAQIASGMMRVGDRIPSESEMMNRYFVSSITVKNALNGLVDEGIIYRLKGKGSFVAASPFTGSAQDQPDHVISVIFPTMATRVEQVYLVHIERECRLSSCRLMVGISRESPDQEIQLAQDFIKSGAQALLLFPTVSEIHNALVRQLVAHRFPIVQVDRYLEDTPAPCVASDNEGGARMATRHLIERCQERVAIFHFPVYNTAVSSRLDGFRAAMREAGYTPAVANECMIEDKGLLFASSERRVELLYDTMLAHLRAHPQIDGLFATNAEIAQVAALVLHTLGRTPGRDAHMVAFDNPHLSGVSFIQQDYRTVIAKSMQMLLMMLDGHQEKTVYTVPVRLIEVPAQPTDIRDMRHLVTGLNP